MERYILEPSEVFFQTTPAFNFLGDSMWSRLRTTDRVNLCYTVLCVPLEGLDRDGGREMQEGGDMGIYVYI